MESGWKSERVRLVPLEDRHFENCLAWINDPVVTAGLKLGDFPMARLAEREWFDSICRGSQTNVMFAIETLDGEHIGNSGIHGINLRNGFATTGTLIGNVDFHGMGYGTEAAKLRAWYCFHVLGLRILLSSYLEGNEASRKMQEKAGYVARGVVPKQYWKRGMFRDHFETILTRERWQELSGGNPSW